MLAVGLVVLLAGYSAVYVGVERLRGDKRGVIDIWKGVGAVGPTPQSSSGSGPLTEAPGPLTKNMPLPGSPEPSPGTTLPGGGVVL